MAQTGPIFIHSLFRCASTFFFQKFRALGADFTCYQEPFNESLEALNRSARQARLVASPAGSTLRHPPLDRPYFYEFWQRRQQLKGLYRRAFAYQQYFAAPALPAAQQRWIAALLAHAQGRAVLQFCRSSGRAPALRGAFGGVHLHLWREPRAQWWSYKVSDYFDSVTGRIYAAPTLPAPLAQLRRYLLDDAAAAAALPAQHNYALYYGIWLHAWLALSAVADISISVDRITVSAAENHACAQRLARLLGQRLELSDVCTSGMVFMPDELQFYESMERQVGRLFVASGANAALVSSAESAAADLRLAHARRAHDAPAERNLRQAAFRMMEPRQQGRRVRRSSRDASGGAGAATTPLGKMLQRLWPLRSAAGGSGESHSEPPLSAVTETVRDSYHRD
jgi:hypothetical protein